MEVRILEGSTILEVDAPTLMEADPEEFVQQRLFPEVDPDRTGIDYLAESLGAAGTGGNGQQLYDKQLLDLFLGFERVFDHGIEAISIEEYRHDTRTVVDLRPEDLAKFSDLETKIPDPQEAMVGGKLDSIRHSDRTFTLVLPQVEERVKGIAEPALLAQLQEFWGQPVLVSGVAYFASNGQMLRLEATGLKRASEQDVQFWAVLPEPIGKALEMGEVRVPQTKRTGLNAIIGRWPGDEHDEQIDRLLEELS